MEAENPYAKTYPPLDHLDLTEAARKALAREFWSGEVTGESRTEELDCLGAKAMHLSIAHDDIAVCRRAVAVTLNALAERGFVVGRRSGPFEVTICGDHAIEMRVMIAPGKYEAASALLSGGGA